MKATFSKGLGFLLARNKISLVKNLIRTGKNNHETKRKMKGNEKYLFNACPKKKLTHERQEKILEKMKMAFQEDENLADM